MTEESSDTLGDDVGDLARGIDRAEASHLFEHLRGLYAPATIEGLEMLGKVVAFAQIPEVGVGVAEDVLVGHDGYCFDGLGNGRTRLRRKSRGGLTRPPLEWGLGEACGRDGARLAVCLDLELLVPLESVRGTDGSEIACSTHRDRDNTTDR